jgi:hypothetical protein
MISGASPSETFTVEVLLKVEIGDVPTVGA